jgi:hypothetical protein
MGGRFIRKGAGFTMYHSVSMGQSQGFGPFVFDTVGTRATLGVLWESMDITEAMARRAKRSLETRRGDLK